MRLTLCLLMVLFTTSRQGTAFADDFDDEVSLASEKIQEAMPACSELLDAGAVEGANAQLLATFPEQGRSAAEAFALANTLYEIDGELSYALHKAAAQAEPENIYVQWEWGMEQHRAGEYSAALESY